MESENPFLARMNWDEIEVSEYMIRLYMSWWTNTWFEEYVDIDEIPQNELPKDFVKARANKLYQLRKFNFDQSFKIWYVMQPVLSQHANELKKIHKQNEEDLEDYLIMKQKLHILENKVQPNNKVDVGTDCPNAFLELERIR